MPAHVVVDQLHKRYGRVEALRGVSFEIERGEIFGLLGPNGAGKTTTLECLVALREADSGELTVGGIDVRRRPKEVRQRIGVALQSSALPDKITPREALGLFGAFYRERVAPEVLLERFALTEMADAAFDTLSGGQRQRLALALAFVNRPEVVLLDEPTAGLDPQARRELHGEIARMKADGHTVLLTTHYLEEAEQLCDRLAILDAGRVIATGTPQALIAGSSQRQAVTLVTSGPLSARQLAGLPSVREAVADGNQAHFRTDDPTAAVAALMRLVVEERLEVRELSVRQATLEEIFLSLTGAKVNGSERGGRGEAGR